MLYCFIITSLDIQSPASLFYLVTYLLMFCFLSRLLCVCHILLLCIVILSVGIITFSFSLIGKILRHSTSHSPSPIILSNSLCCWCQEELFRWSCLLPAFLYMQLLWCLLTIDNKAWEWSKYTEYDIYLSWLWYPSLSFQTTCIYTPVINPKVTQ